MPKPKFTRLPKTTDLREIGLPPEVMPTFWCLADHASNKTGRCWPEIQTIARILGRATKTIQRHVNILEEYGLVKRERRRRTRRGRYSSWLYCLIFFARITSGHRGGPGRQRPIKNEHKHGENTPPNPPKTQKRRSRRDPEPPDEQGEDFKEGYEWFFR